MKKEELAEVLELYKICSDIHAYLEDNNYETLAVPSSQWWQQHKQYGLVKRISKNKRRILHIQNRKIKIIYRKRMERTRRVSFK